MVRNQAPPVRKRISAPVTAAGHKMRITRRRHCLWCENGRVGEKEARRKIELSGIRSESSCSQVKRFHDFPAPRNGHQSFFSPAKKDSALIIISHQNHGESPEPSTQMPISRPRKFPSSFFHIGEKETSEHPSDCEMLAMVSSHPARKEP